MNQKIVVIGSSNIDLVMQVDRFPQAGETVTGGIFSQANGGKGANQAIAAARAGGQIGFISCLGQDSYGHHMLEAFAQDHIDTAYIVQTPEAATGTALIQVDQAGENSISVAPGANFVLSPTHIESAKPLLEQASYVLLQCEIHPDTLNFVIDYVHAMGKKILLNLAPAIKITPDRLKKIHLLIVNELEANFVSGMPVHTTEEIQAAAAHIQSMVQEGVIITLGKQGSFVATSSLSAHIPAFSAQALDTTGAGDCYCGSLTAALCQDMSLSESIRFASAAAAISVTRLGAQPSAPYKQEILDFLFSQEA